MKLSKWILLPDCAMLVTLGTDPDRMENRMAFVEKTPRIRIRSMQQHIFPDAWKTDYLNWCERPWKGQGPNDPTSIKWCEDMLVLLGYELQP